jgi:hypothetical protein
VVFSTGTLKKDLCRSWQKGAGLKLSRGGGSVPNPSRWVVKSGVATSVSSWQNTSCAPFTKLIIRVTHLSKELNHLFKEGSKYRLLFLRKSITWENEKMIVRGKMKLKRSHTTTSKESKFERNRKEMRLLGNPYFVNFMCVYWSLKLNTLLTLEEFIDLRNRIFV